MLLLTFHVRKAKIDEFNIIVLNHLQDFINAGHLRGSFCFEQVDFSDKDSIVLELSRENYFHNKKMHLVKNS